jgi:hypothetical protein
MSSESRARPLHERVLGTSGYIKRKELTLTKGSRVERTGNKVVKVWEVASWNLQEVLNELDQDAWATLTQTEKLGIKMSFSIVSRLICTKGVFAFESQRLRPLNVT